MEYLVTPAYGQPGDVSTDYVHGYVKQETADEVGLL